MKKEADNPYVDNCTNCNAPLLGPEYDNLDKLIYTIRCVKCGHSQDYLNVANIFRRCKPIAECIWRHDSRTGSFEWQPADQEALDAFQKLMEACHFDGYAVRDEAVLNYGYNELDWRALVGTVDVPGSPPPPSVGSQQKSTYALEQLLQGVTAENLHSEVDTGPAIGKEIW